MARSYPSPGGEIWHLSNAGPGKFQRVKPDNSVVLQWSPGGLALLLAPIAVKDAKAGREVHWVCSATTPDDRRIKQFHYPQGPGAEQRSVDVRFQGDVSDELYKGYYAVFANSALWMTMHGRPHELAPEALRDAWEDYKEVNQKFANTVIEQAGKDATVIVHDFQLLLAPSMIKAQRPDLKITGYLHVPFATANEFLQSRSKTTRMGLPDDIAKTIIEAMEDVPWGFHSWRWARNFEQCLNKSQSKTSKADRRHGTEQTKYAVPGFIDPDKLRTQAWGLNEEEFNNRARALLVSEYKARDKNGDSALSTLSDEAFHKALDDINNLSADQLQMVGEKIAPEDFARLEAAREPAISEQQYENVLRPLRSNYDQYQLAMEKPRASRSQIITMVGRGDPKNGILNGLLAYKALIQDPTVINKPSLLLVCSQTRPGVPIYDAHWEAIENEVNEIQDMRNSNLVHFRGEPYEVTLAAQHLADIALVPSERGGRDLVAIEPVVVRRPTDKPVVVVVSEGAAASETLNGSYVARNVGPPPVVVQLAKESDADFQKRSDAILGEHQKQVVANIAEGLKAVINMDDQEFDERSHQQQIAVGLENQAAWALRLEAAAKGHFLAEGTLSDNPNHPLGRVNFQDQQVAYGLGS